MKKDNDFNSDLAWEYIKFFRLCFVFLVLLFVVFIWFVVSFFMGAL